MWYAQLVGRQRPHSLMILSYDISDTVLAESAAADLEHQDFAGPSLTEYGSQKWRAVEVSRGEAK